MAKRPGSDKQQSLEDILKKSDERIEARKGMLPSELLKLQREQDKIEKEKKKLYYQMMTVRNSIIRVYGIKEYIDDMRSIINDSDFFYFRTEEAEKYIDEKDPTFSLALIPEKLEEFHKSTYEQTDDGFTEFISKYVFHDIFNKWSKNIHHFLDEHPEILETAQGNGFDDDELNFVISSMYSYSGLTNNTIMIKMVL